MVFDFSRYLIGRCAGTLYGRCEEITKAKLINERAQDYEIEIITFTVSPQGYATPVTKTSTIRIGETHSSAPRAGDDAVYTQRAWWDIGIPASEWNAYKRWLIEKECVLSDFAW